MLTAIVKSVEEKLLKTGLTDPDELDRVEKCMVKIAEANEQIAAAFASIGEVDYPKDLDMFKPHTPEVSFK
jgi:hypothetical protein